MNGVRITTATGKKKIGSVNTYQDNFHIDQQCNCTLLNHKITRKNRMNSLANGLWAKPGLRPIFGCYELLSKNGFFHL